MAKDGGHWIELSDEEVEELAVDNLPETVVEKALRILEPLPKHVKRLQRAKRRRPRRRG